MTRRRRWTLRTKRRRVRCCEKGTLFPCIGLRSHTSQRPAGISTSQLTNTQTDTVWTNQGGPLFQKSGSVERLYLIIVGVLWYTASRNLCAGWIIQARYASINDIGYFGKRENACACQKHPPYSRRVVLIHSAKSRSCPLLSIQ